MFLGSTKGVIPKVEPQPASAKILKKIMAVTEVLMLVCKANAITRHPVPNKMKNCRANRPRIPYFLATMSERMPPIARAKMLQSPKDEAAIEACW